MVFKGTEHCKRCGNDWPKRKRHPIYCPRCKSKYWNKDRQRDPKAYSKLRTRFAYA